MSHQDVAQFCLSFNEVHENQNENSEVPVPSDINSEDKSQNKNGRSYYFFFEIIQVAKQVILVERLASLVCYGKRVVGTTVRIHTQIYYKSLTMNIKCTISSPGTCVSPLLAVQHFCSYSLPHISERTCLPVLDCCHFVALSVANTSPVLDIQTHRKKKNICLNTF